MIAQEAENVPMPIYNSFISRELCKDTDSSADDITHIHNSPAGRKAILSTLCHKLNPNKMSKQSY